MIPRRSKLLSILFKQYIKKRAFRLSKQCVAFTKSRFTLSLHPFSDYSRSWPAQKLSLNITALRCFDLYFIGTSLCDSPTLKQNKYPLTYFSCNHWICLLFLKTYQPTVAKLYSVPVTFFMMQRKPTSFIQHKFLTRISGSCTWKLAIVR